MCSSDLRERERKLDNTDRRDSKKTISISVCEDTRRSKTRRTQEIGHHTFYRNFEYVVKVDYKREFKTLSAYQRQKHHVCREGFARNGEL